MYRLTFSMLVLLLSLAVAAVRAAESDAEQAGANTWPATMGAVRPGATDEITDHDLASLDTKLPALDLAGSRVSDGGLAHLERSIQLRELIPDGTHITDAGLEHVKGLLQLRI